MLVPYFIMPEENRTLQTDGVWGFQTNLMLASSSGFGHLSGLQTRGYMACPTCGPDLVGVSRRSHICNKIIYMGHTRYLPLDHAWRRDAQYYLDPWEGGDDTRPIPIPKTPAYWGDVWERVADPDDPLQYAGCGIVHQSVLSILEYWEELMINHLLDTMHIEGNVVKSLVMHMFGQDSKALKWREMCIEQSVHVDLWYPVRNAQGQMVMPPAPWVLSPAERREFRRRIATLRFPTNYGANLRMAFGDDEKGNWPAFLKTHDYHRLIHHIIPVAIIGLGSPELRDAIWSLASLMRWVCGKEIAETEVDAKMVFAAEVVCKLEKALPPSFFDGQIHLLVHLVREVSIAGPVHTRWMYWVERYMGYMKSLVRTRARVEGSIAEKYLAAESMFYCRNILATVDPDCPRGWMQEKVDDEDDRLTGAVVERMLTSLEVKQITSFMLSNNEAMDEWREHYEVEKGESRRPAQFPRFIDYMNKMMVEMEAMLRGGDDISHFPEITDDVRTLMHGPLLCVTTRTAMWSTGRHFRISRLDERRSTQDCGVMGTFTQVSRSSAHDTNPVHGVIHHYGKIEEIMIVQYDSYTKFDEVLLSCKWFKVNLAGINATAAPDECGFTRLKTTSGSVYRDDWASSEPFVFPHQVDQCFYVPHPEIEGWSIVIPYIPRSRSVVQEKPELVVVDDADHD